MPRRNRNVATLRSDPHPDLGRALFCWDLEPRRVAKPSVKRNRFRIYGGER